MDFLNKKRYLKNKELRKVRELEDSMKDAESIDAIAWAVIIAGIVALFIFGVRI